MPVEIVPPPPLPAQPWWHYDLLCVMRQIVEITVAVLISLLYLITCALYSMSMTIRGGLPLLLALALALVMTATLASAAPVVVLPHGGQVLCGGARLWVCDAEAEFDMVEATVYSAKKPAPPAEENRRLFLPEDYYPSTALAPFPFFETRQAERRDQREIFLHVDRMHAGAHVTARFEIYASALKLAEILGNYRVIGLSTMIHPEDLRFAEPVQFMSAPPSLREECAENGVLLLVDHYLERSSDPIASLDDLPRHCRHIVLGFTPRNVSGPPPIHMYRQWTVNELVLLVQSRGFDVFYVTQHDPWIEMRHRDAPSQVRQVIFDTDHHSE